MKRQTLARILLVLGVCVWIPFFALKLAGAEAPTTPFLVAHLIGVVPGALLAPEKTLIHRLLKRTQPEDDQAVI